MIPVGGYFRRFGMAVGLLTLAEMIFLAIRLLITGTSRYAFIPWNLALAWTSLALAVLLVNNLKLSRWSGWQNITLSVLWLAFLPNTWYVLTDFIHIYPNGEISQLYDIVLVSLLVFIGFALGCASLLLVHRELIKRFGEYKSYLFVEAAILISSFAIYLGRDLRWNTWDVITNPSGVIVNVSDRIFDPFGQPRALNVTLLFFTLLSVVYGAVWILAYPQKPRRR